MTEPALPIEAVRALWVYLGASPLLWLLLTVGVYVLAVRLQQAAGGELLSLVAEVRYAQAYSFKYSPRPGTPAATMDDQISPSVMALRLERLQALLGKHQHEFNEATVGQTCGILLERKGKLEGQLIGKTPWLQSAHVDVPGLQIGDMVHVQIEQAGHSSVSGKVMMKEGA